MFVAIMNADWDLRLPVAVFLTETRVFLADRSCIEDHFAYDKLREAWQAFGDGDHWAAVVEGIAARVLAAHCEERGSTLELHEVEGRALCAVFRESYPGAPPGFEKVGRLADGKEPDG
jgi:hypothetical protein